MLRAPCTAAEGSAHAPSENVTARRTLNLVCDGRAFKDDMAVDPITEYIFFMKALGLVDDIQASVTHAGRLTPRTGGL